MVILSKNVLNSGLVASRFYYLKTLFHSEKGKTTIKTEMLISTD